MSDFAIETSKLSSGALDSQKVIDQALTTVRQHLGMHVAYLSEFVDGQSVFRNVDAPGLEDLIKVGDSRSLEDVYCKHILEGRLPEMIPDTAAEPIAAAMPITKAVPIGSHMSIPILLESGEPFGMFCCLSPEPNHSLNSRDLETMRIFANLAANQVNHDHAAQQALREKKTSIESALQTRAFNIAYQPIVDLGEMRPTGYESLCRFSAEPYRTPDLWFHDAADAGLSVELELAAIQQALEALPRLEAHQYLSINASPGTVVSDAFVDTMTATPLSQVVLEITEHAIVEDYDRLTGAIDALRERGMRLAVDDAGAGHSSLRHIVQLSPEFIKLDMSLTRNVDKDLARRALVGALMFYTRETSAQIIAEGIETEAELETLKLLGVRRGQGYLLGKPSFDQFETAKPKSLGNA